MRNIYIAIAAVLTSLPVGSALAAGEADPVLTTLWIDQLEHRQSGGEDVQVLESDLWIGRDLDKVWFKVDGEKEEEEDTLEVQALYSRAIAPYWDLQMGVRHDFEPGPERNWAVLGLQGLAPYFFEVDAALFVGESGRTALRFDAEYELHLTQRLILAPLLELNFYGQNEDEREIGSGLANGEAGLRLRYEIRREFAPYVGVNWSKSFGNTADLVEAAGGDSSDTQWLVGLRAWF